MVPSSRSLLVAAILASLLLAGCTPTEPADAEPVPVTIGVPVALESAALHLGVEAGLFEDRGLEVTLVPLAPAELSAQLAAGDIRFALLDYVLGMTLVEAGGDFVFVAGGASTVGDPDSRAVVVRDGSTVRDAAALAGRTVAVESATSVEAVVLAALVAADGGEQPVAWVETPAAEQFDALRAGQVQAALLSAYRTGLVGAGYRAPVMPRFDFDPGLPAAGLAVSAAALEDDPELVRVLREAMNASLRYASDRPDETRRAAASILGLDAEADAQLIASLVLPRFEPGFNREALARLGEAAVDAGVLAASPDLGTLIR